MGKKLFEYESKPQQRYTVAALRYWPRDYDDIKETLGDNIRKGEGDAQLWVAANGSWINLSPGEWIILDEYGYYPCQNTVFEKKYQVKVAGVDVNTYANLKDPVDPSREYPRR